MSSFIAQIEIMNIMAYMPEYKNGGCSGAELMASESTTISDTGVEFVHTGIKVKVPSGFEVQVRNVGKMIRRGMCIFGGMYVISANDSDVELVVPIQNVTNRTIEIKLGDAFAQLVFTKVEHVRFERRKV